MDQQVANTSVRIEFPLKRLAPAELRGLIDLAFTSPERTSVTVTWADGRQAHALDEPGLDNLDNYPKTDVVRVDVSYTDDSHLTYEPTRGAVTATGDDGNEAVACANKLRDEYEAIPNRRGAILAAKLTLRVSLIAILLSSAILFLHVATSVPPTYRIGLLVLWAIVLIGCGTWSEYLEWRVDPARTHQLPAHSHWYSQPAVAVATISAATAVVLVAAAVFVRLTS
jgi:hypothetical protein